MLDFKTKFDPKSWYVTSDWHLNHVNMCSATTKWDKGYREFPSLDLMNDTIIARCNEKVPENGHLFVVGDVLFGNKALYHYFRGRIVCQNIYLILGNHDQWLYDKIKAKDGLELCQLKWAGNLAEIRVGYQNIVLGHYAMKVWNKSHHKSWMLYGHSHGSLPDEPNSLSCDIGIDTKLDYSPYSYYEIEKIMQNKQYQPIDHHNKNTNS